MPKIAYVCEECWADAGDSSCWEDRSELRVAPDGKQLCQGCYEDSRWDYIDQSAGDDADAPLWSDLPMPPEYLPAQSAT